MTMLMLALYVFRKMGEITVRLGYEQSWEKSQPDSSFCPVQAMQSNRRTEFCTLRSRPKNLHSWILAHLKHTVLE